MKNQTFGWEYKEAEPARGGPTEAATSPDYLHNEADNIKLTIIGR
jgi:hypothetical protein